MAVRAILFDVGGVLEMVGEPVWALDWGMTLTPGAGSLESVTAALDPDDQLTTGAMSELELRMGFRDALGLSDLQSQALMAGLWDWYCGTLDRDLFAWARDMSRHLQVGILSNSADGARREEEARYGFSKVFQPIIYSHEVGLAKPDPACFRLATRMLGCQPDEVVLLDDMEANVAGARAVGMRAVLHRSSGGSISEVTALLAH